MKEILHIYSRVSSAIQLEGTSIQVQTSIGIELASKLGMDYKKHDEGSKSSANDDLSNRPVMNNLLKQMDLGTVKHLYAFNTDRISRNQITWFLIRQKMVKNSVKLYTPKGVHDTQDGLENMVLGILSEISQYDNSLRSQRSRLGKLEKVKQNYWRGGLTTFGYTLESDGIANKLAKDPIESKWVNHIFTQYVNGVSLVEVKQELESNNILTKRGHTHWSLGSLQTIIRNKNYIGIDIYTDGKTGESVTNVIPALISIELYEKATQVRKGKLSKRRQFSKLKHSYLLRDFLTCGGCTTPMAGRVKKVKDEQFYYCPLPERKFNSSKKTNLTCPVKKSMDINSADDEIWNVITKVLSDTESLKSKMYEYNLLGDGANATIFNDSITKSRNQLAELCSSIGTVENAIINAESSNALGEYSSPKIYQGVKKKLQSQYDNLLHMRKEIESKLQLMENQDELLNVVELYGSLLEDATVPEGVTDAGVTGEACPSGSEVAEGITPNGELTRKRKHIFLSNILDNITVNYDHEKKKHLLDISFNLPLSKNLDNLTRNYLGSKFTKKRTSNQPRDTKNSTSAYSTVTLFAKFLG